MLEVITTDLFLRRCKNMSKFQIAVLSVFSVAIVLGLVFFATSRGSSSSSANLLVWGTISDEAFNAAHKASSAFGSKTIKVTYVKKDVADFQQSFVEALADGTGPDIIIVRDDFVYQNRNKIFTVPYKNYTERTFKDTFIEEGEMFLSSQGTIAFPFMVDPLVMYWNRDIFQNNLLSQPPKYWDEFASDKSTSLVGKITKRDNNANILQSAVALGEWRNIINAKEILAMIFLQAGTPITSRNGDKVESQLNNSYSFPVLPSLSAINFYTQFSNPTSPAYTWNRSLPNSLNMFLAGNLATYIGFASEIFPIKQKNQNLNFDVTYAPQIRGSAKRTVFGHMYSLSIVKQSKQVSGAYTLIMSLIEPGPIKALEVVTSLPPVRRDLLTDRPTDAYRAVFYDSALISHSWIDPDPTGTSNTFRDMVESITGGKAGASESINRADRELSAFLK